MEPDYPQLTRADNIKLGLLIVAMGLTATVLIGLTGAHVSGWIFDEIVACQQLRDTTERVDAGARRIAAERGGTAEQYLPEAVQRYGDPRFGGGGVAEGPATFQRGRWAVTLTWSDTVDTPGQVSSCEPARW